MIASLCDLISYTASHGKKPYIHRKLGFKLKWYLVLSQSNCREASLRLGTQHMYLMNYSHLY